MSDYRRAESLRREALEIRKFALGEQHPDYANSLSNLAAMYKDKGDYARAEPLYRQALEIRKLVLGTQHPSYAYSLNSLADLSTSQGDDARAEPLYDQAVEILRTSLDRNSVIQSVRQQYRNQAHFREHLDARLTNTMKLHADAVSPLEDLWQWKGTVTARQRACGEVASNVTLAPRFKRLQTVSRQLSAFSGKTPIPPAKKATDADRAAYTREREDWEKKFGILSREREDLEQQISAGSEEFRRVREALTVAELRQWLPAGIAFVDFLEYQHAKRNTEQKGETNSERRFLAFAVRPDRKPAMIGLGSAASLTEAVTAFRRPFRSEENTTETRRVADKSAQQIRRDLWLPIEAHLDGVDTVIISPDTALGTLPFGALPGKKNGSYLLEDYRIAMLPMANLLPAIIEKEPTDSGSGLLLVGNVDYNADTSAAPSTADTPLLLADARGLRGQQGQWVSLSGFREELESVESQYQRAFGDSASVLSLAGQNATENAFLENTTQYKTLHIITHGYFEDPSVKSIAQANVQSDAIGVERPGRDPFISTYLPGLLSGLVMAGANNPSDDPDDPRDGILRASEIEASSMQGVDLVVLSACETGLGAVAGGEGLTGLQRAFHIAGARSVIASLWKVDDRATQELMRRFYTNLWEHDMTKADALREAQLWMLRHPKELEEMGVNGAATRGLIRKTKQVDPTKKTAGTTDRTDPYFWAAFQLSGDWR